MPSVTHSSIKVKKMNEELVRQAIRLAPYGTKSSIAQATGLSVATCGTLLKEMLDSGEALEDEPEASSGGRRARRFVYNADYSYIACIYAVFEKGRSPMPLPIRPGISSSVVRAFGSSWKMI